VVTSALAPHRIRITRPDGTVTTSWRTDDGQFNDPTDGGPAVVVRDPGGVIVRVEHWRDGLLDDPADGTPAVWERRGGTGVAHTEHWCSGHRRDGSVSGE